MIELGIEAEGLERGLDGFDLITIVVDGELRQDAELVGDEAGVLPQQAGAERVERAHGDPVERSSLAEVLDAGAHLAGGLVREGDGEDAVAGNLLDFHQVGDAMGEDARLARPGSRDDENRAVDGKHGFALGVVEPGEEFGSDGGGDRIQRRQCAPGPGGTRTVGAMKV